MFFKKEKVLKAFCAGYLLPLKDVKDEVFSNGMMGPGFAIVPENGYIFSPISGVISMVFPTKHALGIHTDDGMDIILHIGIDTVTLKGHGFDVLVKQNQKVKVGDPLINVDLSILKENNRDTTSICVITDPKNIELKFLKQSTNVNINDSILKIRK